MDKKITIEEPFDISQDVNQNGIIDDDELTESQRLMKKQHKLNQRDLKFVFYTIYAFTLAALSYMFISFNKYQILLSIDISKLANTLNVFIVIIGLAEGLRSLTKTGVDTLTPVPAYKLRILFWYLLSFCMLTLVAIVFEFITKSRFTNVPKENVEQMLVLPEYGTNEFIDGLTSNVIAYLFARYGNKLAENIDLSSFKFFKNKK